MAFKLFTVRYLYLTAATEQTTKKSRMIIYDVVKDN